MVLEVQKIQLKLYCYYGVKSSEKWSTIVRLLPCASLSVETIFPISITSCVEDIERCGLFIDIISTDNYSLNVKLFKLFSPSGKLETCVLYNSEKESLTKLGPRLSLK